MTGYRAIGAECQILNRNEEPWGDMGAGQLLDLVGNVRAARRNCGAVNRCVGVEYRDLDSGSSFLFQV